MAQREFYPKSEDEVKEILLSAQSSGCRVHPFAGGYNWGYGETRTPSPHPWKIHFKNMNQILSFDPELGIVKIQPGVTQKDLCDYLSERNLDFYVPNTGAGARGSILGNALERGFGIAPLQDHASSLLSFKGYLADGTVYQSPLKEINSTLADCFQWGVGPHFDSLVSQSPWIIITEASIQLIRKFKHTDLLGMSFQQEELGSVIDQLRELLQKNPGSMNSIKIFNQKQVLKPGQKDFRPAFLSKIQKEWFLIVTVYSNDETRTGNLKSVKRELRRADTGPVIHFTEFRIRLLRKILNFFSFNFLQQIKVSVEDLSELMRLSRGFTSEVGYKALDPNFNPQTNDLYDMGQLKNRFVWFSPLCVLRSKDVKHLYDLILEHQKVSPFKFKTLTWTVLNSKTIALVAPIEYSLENGAQFFQWFEFLHLDLKHHGFIPYRFHTRMMKPLVQDLLPEHFKLVDRFNKLFDQDRAFMPGKYSYLPENNSEGCS